MCCQKPGGPVLPGKPLGLFLNLFLCGLILNVFVVSLGTRWGFRCLKSVLRPYFLCRMSYSFPKPVLHVPNVEETQSVILIIHSIRVHGGSGHLPKAYLAKVFVEQWELPLELVKDLASRATVLVGAYASTRRAISNYYRVIVFLKYPTQYSKRISGVLKFGLRSLI